jgi:hypothetical protein
MKTEGESILEKNMVCKIDCEFTVYKFVIFISAVWLVKQLATLPVQLSVHTCPLSACTTAYWIGMIFISITYKIINEVCIHLPQF